MCGLVSRQACHSRLSLRFCGGRTSRPVITLAGRRHCPLVQCAYERGLASCSDCPQSPCRFHRQLHRVCPVADQIVTRRRRTQAPALRTYQEAVVPPDLPRPALGRIQWYQQVLEQLAKDGVHTTSSDEIARRAGVKPSLVRKDLSRFGRLGTPSLGYDVKGLRGRLAAGLGLDQTRHAAWVGARRLLNHPDLLVELRACRCEVVVVIDCDTRLQGREVGSLVVSPPSVLPDLMEEQPIDLAVLDLPERAAQAAAEDFINAGVRRFLSYTRTPLNLPPGVKVQHTDIATNLLVLLSADG